MFFPLQGQVQEIKSLLFNLFRVGALARCHRHLSARPGGSTARQYARSKLFASPQSLYTPRAFNLVAPTPGVYRRWTQSWFCGEQNHGRKEVNQKVKPFERGKTLQNFAERQSDQRLSPQVRPIFAFGENRVWPEAKRLWVKRRLAEAREKPRRAA